MLEKIGISQILNVYKNKNRENKETCDVKKWEMQNLFPFNFDRHIQFSYIYFSFWSLSENLCDHF